MALEDVAGVGDELTEPVTTLDFAPVALAGVDHQRPVHDPSLTKGNVRAHASILWRVAHPDNRWATLKLSQPASAH
jgi:hypothetical protein